MERRSGRYNGLGAALAPSPALAAPCGTAQKESGLPRMAPFVLAPPAPTPTADYWGWFNKRAYHHTGPVSTFYAMREALAIVGEEGLQAMWERHLQASAAGGAGGGYETGACGVACLAGSRRPCMRALLHACSARIACGRSGPSLRSHPAAPAQAHQLLWEGLAELGLEPFVADPKDR